MFAKQLHGGRDLNRTTSLTVQYRLTILNISSVKLIQRKTKVSLKLAILIILILSLLTS